MERMARLIPPVLHSPELPLAVLSAARLDGQLWGVYDGFTPVDEPDRPDVRALALLPSIDERDVVVGRSAAWLHGARSVLPMPIEVCGNPHRRGRARGVRFRELIIRGDDVIRLADGRLRTTGIRRTIRDIAFERERLREDDDMVGFLSRYESSVVRACMDDIAARGRQPGKVNALAYLAKVADTLSAQPPFTR